LPGSPCIKNTRACAICGKPMDFITLQTNTAACRPCLSKNCFRIRGLRLSIQDRVKSLVIMRKPRARLSKALLLTAAALIACAPPAKAATYQWDVNGSTLGLGGTGTWTAANNFWDEVGLGLDSGSDATGPLPLDASLHTLRLGGSATGTLSFFPGWMAISSTHPPIH
jgi:hypothetical protein